MTYYLVYKITNNINGKIYVGFHKTNNLDDGYMGSGKLIKAAIKKYSKENFTKEILKLFDNKEEAEEYEALIVNKEFTLREDTYNVAVGGNVRILHGPNNGFYGKHHSEETKRKASENKKGVNLESHFRIIIDGVSYTSKQATEKLGITKNERLTLIRYCGDPNINVTFKDQEEQKAAEEYYIDWIQRIKVKKEKLSKSAKERFTGYVWSEERNAKLSASLKGRKLSEEHINKTNRNPEKIRKTAEKHRGMKRSEEAKRKMSLAKLGKPTKNKGKMRIKDSTGNTIMWTIGEDIPEGYKKVTVKKAIDGNGNHRMLDTDVILPTGWYWINP